MAVLKVIELMANSSTSWEDATKNAVTEARKSLKGVSSVYVQDMSASVDDSGNLEYRVNVKITFRLQS